MSFTREELKRMGFRFQSATAALSKTGRRLHRRCNDCNRWFEARFITLCSRFKGVVALMCGNCRRKAELRR